MAKRRFTFDFPYFAAAARIGIPIALQQGISASINMLDVLMIGQLGETSVAAAALANQIAFLLTFFLYGITSGAAAFTAQFWGNNDVPSIRKVLGICLTLCVSVSIIFTLVAEFIPGPALSLYTQDPAVIASGIKYLQIAGLGYFFSSISMSYSSVLKGMGLVRIPAFAIIVSLGVKLAVSYSLIFGHFCLPALGLVGGAVGTLVARTIELTLLLAAVFKLRTPLAAHPKELMTFHKPFTVAYLKVALPVVANEILWSMGVSIYSAIYARMGTDAIAAINLATSLEGMAFVLLIANSDAGGIMTGSQIGAGDFKTAYCYARRTLASATVLGILVGAILMALSGVYPRLYQVSAPVQEDASRILLIMGLLFWVRGSNLTLIVGVMRSGGDTRFSALLDIGTVWLVGIPLAFLGAFALSLSVWLVYLLVMGDEITKYIFGLRRFLSKHWIHDLARISAAG